MAGFVDRLGWNPDVAVLVLASAGFVLLVAAVVFLVLWRRARNALAWHEYDEAIAQQDLTAMQLTLSDQRARMQVIRELDEVVILQHQQLIAQLEGAAVAAERDPDLAARANAQVTETIRATIGDMRRIVGIAMEGEAASDDKPQFEAIGRLWEEAAAKGLKITVRETGERYTLLPGAEIALYNVIKDALDNSLKHGGVGTEVAVDLEWTAEGFRVRIEDNGKRNQAMLAGADPDRTAQTMQSIITDEIASFVHVVSGPSLSRMRERVEAFGGVLQVSELPGVGFTVSATYPSLRFHNGVHGVNLARR